MHRLFGRGKPKKPPPNLNECIGKVDSRVEGIEKKIQILDNKLRKYKDQMAKIKEGPSMNALKQKALCVLNKKKQYEQQVESLRNQSFNMEQVNYVNQMMKDTQATVVAMKDGMKSMKKEFKKINIEDIEDLQDDMTDMLEQADEVQKALGRDYNMPEIDEDVLQAELDALGDEFVLDDDSSYLNDIIKAPGIPDKEPGANSVVAPSSKTKDGVLVDEFGLPQLPAASSSKQN
ncbi:hypothetical protein PVAND_006278 [Polypedilum vanderplanki]|uniref:Charged multivesicular body protein 5 n=1 Tax=Polypedilum vanderplanki TaxID=319348 RepID=A0A9J6C3K0_POLVA|nr:hypothetical protein PVAND_006278 [Polypedilum vanderplanki]